MDLLLGNWLRVALLEPKGLDKVTSRCPFQPKQSMQNQFPVLRILYSYMFNSRQAYWKCTVMEQR